MTAPAYPSVTVTAPPPVAHASHPVGVSHTMGGVNMASGPASRYIYNRADT